MITQETACAIWTAYREINAAKKLLNDMDAALKAGMDKTAPSLKDAFGRPRYLQLGVPSGQDCHRLMDVHPELAASVIRGHIARKIVELADANERARIELESDKLKST